GAQQCHPSVPPTCAQQCTHLCHPAVPTSATHQCSSAVLPVSAQQFSDASQCHLSMPSIRDTSLVPPIRATSLVLPINSHQCCPSVPPFSAHQCCLINAHQ
ncbi:unnamed protein product, partial [Staurois parvus]